MEPQARVAVSEAWEWGATEPLGLLAPACPSALPRCSWSTDLTPRCSPCATGEADRQSVAPQGSRYKEGLIHIESQEL